MMWGIMVVEFITACAVGQLVIFHLWLMKKGMTTLEYMIANNGGDLYVPDQANPE
jgi:hypothetical protein